MTTTGDIPAWGQPMSPHKPVVLVVDDDDFQLKIIELVLGSGRYDLHFLSDARQALLWLVGARADLVIVDVQMPEVNGLEMTRQLRAKPALHGMPILMMSGQRDDTMVQQCLQAGAQDFVVKPFERANLQAKVAQLLAPQVYPGINAARGLSVWGRVQDYSMFLRKFAVTYADSIEQLRESLAQQDHDAVRSLAHKLRGAAGTMALDDVAYCAGALEMCAPDKAPLPLLTQLQTALDIAMASIAAYTAHHD